MNNKKNKQVQHKNGIAILIIDPFLDRMAVVMNFTPLEFKTRQEMMSRCRELLDASCDNRPVS